MFLLVTDSLAAEARRLRAVEQLSVRQIQDRLGVGKDRLQEMLRGIPAPDWTKRPNAKDDLRARAVELRAEGCSVVDIALELGVAKSTAYQWVRHLPLDRDSELQRTRRQAQCEAMTEGRWAVHRDERERRRAEVHADARGRVGQLDERDLLLLGAAIYWSEGTKSKPWRRNDRIQLINSDVRLLAVFLSFLESCGVDRTTPSYRLSIHESVDVEAAMAWWAQALRLPRERFRRPTLKRHRPTTVRRNVGDDYHGCLIIDVPKSRELYWLVEGVIGGLGSQPG